MRNLVSLLFVTAAWCIPSLALAQIEKKFQPPDIKKVHVGFKTFQQDRELTAAKVGLWTPVYVEVFGGSDGIAPDPERPPYIQIDTVDSEDVGTAIRIPSVFVEPLKTRTFIGYVKTGRAGDREIQFTLYVKGRDRPKKTVEGYALLGIDSHLYLTLGNGITDFNRAVRKMDKQPGDDKEEFNVGMFGNQFRNVVFETDVERLPEVWFGYNSVDLMVLSTDNRRFLTGLGNQPERLKAIAQWVRRGGRLVIPIAKQNQDAVVALLENQAAWQPALPVVPPRAPTDIKLLRLLSVERWGRVQGEPYQANDPKDPLNKIAIPVATLDPGRVPAGDWNVEAESEDGKPLIARVRYGLGQITYMAFSLEDAAFFAWPGKEQFLKAMVENLATKAPQMRQDHNRNFRGQQEIANDLATELLGANGLDNFDVKTIPFGAVAFFIVLYILVVGPLDFLLLKYVFKRLEWTWITFPTVVLAVSVIAYFAAYALKGRDMKINKIDIVDFDLRTSFRTDRDQNGQPRNVHAYGASFFTILSPRIQNYTIGLEPNPAFWGAAVEQVPSKRGGKDDKVLSVDLLSWMGRPSGGMNDMGRPGGSARFGRNSYDFTEDASALVGVPIPVWTTKAFGASWEQTLPKSPFVVDLVYHQKLVRGKELKITGKLENHLGVDLVDVWLIYDKRCYAIEAGLKSVKAGGAPAEISLAANPAEEMSNWTNRPPIMEEPPRISDPTNQVKRILFHESFDINNNVRNHLLRPLDLGWRLQPERIAPGDTRTREGILFARVRYTPGASAESITNDAANPVPTKLWLGDIPDTGKSRPSLSGQMNQDTYIRVLLPLRPSEE